MRWPRSRRQALQRPGRPGPGGQPCRCRRAWLADARGDGGQRQPPSETTGEPRLPDPRLSQDGLGHFLRALRALSLKLRSHQEFTGWLNDGHARLCMGSTHLLLPETRDQPPPLPCRAMAASLESLGEVLFLRRGRGGRQRPLDSPRFPLPSLGPSAGGPRWLLPGGAL